MSVLDREIMALLRHVSEEAILPLYRALDDGQIEAKAPGDVVTVADHAAEAMLTDALAAFEPTLPVVGEEAAHADAAVMDALAGGAINPTKTAAWCPPLIWTLLAALIRSSASGASRNEQMICSVPAGIVIGGV